MSLLPVAEAQARLLGLGKPLAAERVDLNAAAGRILAEDVLAARRQPWRALSAMDGYALRFADMPGPWTVVGESMAGGAPPAPIGPAEAVRIFTGAPLPEGADCILVQEEAKRDGDRLDLSGEGPGRAGKHVRPAASDFAEGQRLLLAGARLTPPAIALVALAGHGTVQVHRRPRVAILSTGSELVPPGAPVAPGKLPSSNGVMLRALLSALPCDVVDLGIAPDDLDDLADTIRRAGDADILVTTGGASVGEHDLVRDALAVAGGTVDFWKIRMRPGKPLIAGRLGETLFLGLPGNPVSALVTGLLFLTPLVRHLSGDPAPLPRPFPARLGRDLPATQVRAEYLRAQLSDGVATPLAEQDSAATLALSQADALILREGSAPPLAAGATVPVIPLPWAN